MVCTFFVCGSKITVCLPAHSLIVDVMCHGSHCKTCCDRNVETRAEKIYQWDYCEVAAVVLFTAAISQFVVINNVTVPSNEVAY